jgi:hypothetical protein
MSCQLEQIVGIYPKMDCQRYAGEPAGADPNHAFGNGVMGQTGGQACPAVTFSGSPQKREEIPFQRFGVILLALTHCTFTRNENEFDG